MSGEIPVRLVVWAANDVAAEIAVAEAGRGWSRETWSIRVERVGAPLWVPEGSEIAERRTRTWAYVALPRGAER
jgi:hypothetical protein